MDSIRVSEAPDPGSIPGEATINESGEIEREHRLSPLFFLPRPTTITFSYGRKAFVQLLYAGRGIAPHPPQKSSIFLTSLSAFTLSRIFFIFK